MKPVISVCVPTHNGEKDLAECLTSVVNQTFTDFEVLILDNASSDRTVDIAREYAAKDQRFRILVNESNLGLTGNLNRSVELAHGEWIKFLFQDDLIASNCLERMFAAIERGDRLIACKRDFVFSPDVPDNIRGFYLSIPSLDGIFAGQNFIAGDDLSNAVLDNLGLNIVGEPIALLFSREIFQKFGKFNPHLLQISDIEFNTRIGINTGVKFIPEILATLRVHDKSTSSFNYAERAFRAGTLDMLIYLHEIVFNPLYRPLRRIARDRTPPMNLYNLLETKARYARITAEDGNPSARHKSPTSMQEWKAMTKVYPRLYTLSRQSRSAHLLSKCLYSLQDRFA